MPELLRQGYYRVEPDDRLLDVFPAATRVKGVELWEMWEDETVHLIRIHNNQQQRFQLPRKQIEQALMSDQKLELNQDFFTDHTV